MKLCAASGFRVNGKMVLELKLNGKIVWSWWNHRPDSGALGGDMLGAVMLGGRIDACARRQGV